MKSKKPSKSSKNDFNGIIDNTSINTGAITTITTSDPFYSWGDNTGTSDISGIVAGDFPITISAPYTIPSSGVTGTLSYDWGTNYDFGPFTMISNTKAICSCCKKEKQGPFLAYKGIKLERYICQNCVSKAFDRMFKVKINREMEEALFEEQE